MDVFGGGLVLLIVKIVYIIELILDRLVSVSLGWTYETPGQWTLMHIDMDPTPKGTMVIDSIMTIIDSGLQFVAQFVTLMPAPDEIVIPHP